MLSIYNRLNSSLCKRVISWYGGPGLRGQLIRGSLGVGGLKFLSLILSFTVSVLLARNLGPEGFGQYSFVITLIGVLVIPIAGAMFQLMLRETSVLHHDENWGRLRGLFRWGHFWVLLGSVFIGGVTGWIASSWARWQVDDRWTLVLICLVAVPFLGLNSLRSGILAGLRHVVIAQLPELVVKPGVQLIFVGFVLWFGVLNPATAMLAQVVSVMIAFLVGTIMLKLVKPCELKTAPINHGSSVWFKAWYPFILLVASSTFNAQIGILLLGWLGTNEDVASLQVAYQGSQLVLLPLIIVNMVIGPHIARVHREGNQEKLQLLSQQSVRIAFIIAVPVGVPMIVFGEQVITLIFGNSYADIATVPLAILVLSQIVNVAFGSVGKLLTMCGYERDTLQGQSIALLINFLLAVLLIPVWGAVGAACAAAIGLITWNFLLAIKVKQRLVLRSSIF